MADFAGLREQKEMGITPKLCAKSRPIPPNYQSQCTLVSYFRRTSRANSPKIPWAVVNTHDAQYHDSFNM